MVCEILCVGTEILLGEIVNTDGAFVAREISSLGFSSYHQSTVGDNPKRLREALEVAFGRSDIVILTGGLGPTCDDITKKTVADEFGLPMYLNEEILEDIKAFFRVRNKEMTDNNIQQAMIPEGATVFRNKWGTAPGIAICGRIHGETKHAILLPGPPSECEPMFDECARPYLQALTGDAIYSLNLHLAGIAESAAEDILRDIMEEYENPTVAPYACEHEVRIRITARAKDMETARSMCREMRDTIRAGKAGEYIYYETDSPFDAKNSTVLCMLEELKKAHKTFAAAESCTSGMITARVGDISGASEFLLGGIVSYSNEVKEKLLGVPHEVLEQYGAVSVQCAGYMAEGARRATGADITVSVTGIAGPLGGTPEKPVGTVCFGVSDENGTYTEKKFFGNKNDRGRIRRLTTAYAMMLVIKRLRGQI